MKKKNEQNVKGRAAARRLELRREILRNISVPELTAVAGGIEPQCMVTRWTQ